MACSVVRNNDKYDVIDCNGNVIDTRDTFEEANQIAEKQNNMDVEPNKYPSPP